MALGFNVNICRFDSGDEISNPRAILAYKYPFPPVDWILSSLGGIFKFIGIVTHYQAKRYDPATKQLNISQPFSAIGSAFGSMALIGVAIALIASGPAATVIAPIFIAIGTVAISISSLISFFNSLADLVKEIKNKKSKDTYKLRILKRCSDCVRLAVNSAFYICVAILSVIAVVALFSNPIGLSVLAASMFTFAIVTASISIGSLILGRIANWRINKIKENRAKKDLKLDPSNILESKNVKRTSLKQVHIL